MDDIQRTGAAGHDLVPQLRLLREQSGSPSYRELERLSRHAKPGLKGYVLTRSNTHEILAGRRRGRLPWPFVAAFVEACYAAAGNAGLRAYLPPESLEDWHARWCEASAAEPVPPVSPVPSQRRLASHDTPAGQQPEPAQERYLRVYGRTGGRLLRHAEDGDPEAAYQLGVLLLCDDSVHEADLWLGRAASAGHKGAQRLHPVAGEDPVECAHRIGDEYAAKHMPSSAEVFHARGKSVVRPWEAAERWLSARRAEAAEPVLRVSGHDDDRAPRVPG
jgi:hypothetical protein